MNESITVDDFSNICRVCLQSEENMMDIFGSGINGQITELINVEIKQDDELPKTLCQKCKLELHNFSEFIKKAKSSELFLKSLLSTKHEEEEDIKKFQKKKRRSKLEKNIREPPVGEKFYLLFVNKPDDSKLESQISIKDIECKSLAQCCESIIRDHLDMRDEKQKLLALNLLGLKDKDKIYAVNLDIYTCSECEEKFEDVKELTAHFLTHKIEKSNIEIDYECPVCDYHSNKKKNFLGHLKTHKDCMYVKVNKSGEMVDVKKDEKSVFNVLKPPIDCSVYCLNLNQVNCAICHSAQAVDTIGKHMEECLGGVKTQFIINYECPACGKLFINEDTLMKHLDSHKKGNFFIIRVNQSNQKSIKDDVYVIGDKLESIIYEIVDVTSCHKCTYTSESFDEVSDHYKTIHDEEYSEKGMDCPVCKKNFQNMTLFYEHLKTHHDVSFILTTKNGALADLKPQYSDIFTQSSSLWDLINSASVHNYTPDVIVSNKPCICEIQQKKKTKKNYICEICGEEVRGKLKYMKHSLKHSKHSVLKKPICSLCRKTFANRTTLNEHLKHHLKEGAELELVCEKCGKSFSNNVSLLKHKKLHSAGKENAALKCDICGRYFIKQSALDKHKSAHLNPKYFECSDCKLPLPSMALLQKHQETHKNGSKTYDCKTCKLSFLTKDSLTAHQTHTGHYLGREPLECNVCHEKFFVGRKFAEHIKSHPKYKMGECTLCGKRLSTIQSLMIHMGRHFETNRILCPHCGKQFFEEKNYHRHLLTHEGVKPFVCNVDTCKKSFYTLFELNRHKKYHNNTRDFKCSYCSKSFHEANHLTVHVRTHTGERPYACPHCNKGFVTRTRCKHHIKLVHQGIGYDLIKTNISKKVTVFETVGIDL